MNSHQTPPNLTPSPSFLDTKNYFSLDQTQLTVEQPKEKEEMFPQELIDANMNELKNGLSKLKDFESYTPSSDLLQISINQNCRMVAIERRYFGGSVLLQTNIPKKLYENLLDADETPLCQFSIKLFDSRATIHSIQYNFPQKQDDSFIQTTRKVQLMVDEILLILNATLNK